MIIGLVTDRIWPFYEGGYERRYWNLAKRLAQKHEVHVLTSCPANTTLDNINFHKVVGYRSYFDRMGYRVLGEDLIYSLSLTKSVFSRYRFDVIDCNATPFTHVPLAKLAALSKGAKMILTVHEALKEGLYNYFRSKHTDNAMLGNLSKILATISTFFITSATRMPDLIIAISYLTKASLERNYGVRDAVVIPNGVDINFFDSTPVDLNNRESFRLVFVGRLVPEKRLVDLIKATNILIHRFHMSVTLSVIGDGPLKKDLVAMSRKLDVANAVIFHGFVGERDKVKLLKTSDVFVLPSEREGFSISTLEAMAASLPTVAALPRYKEACGVKEIVKHNVNGLFYPCGNVESLASTLEMLLTDVKLRARLARNARSTAESYDWSKITLMYEGMIKNLCGKH